MLLRIALFLAIVVLRPVAAWADPAEQAVTSAAKAADSLIGTGPLGALFIYVSIGLVAVCGLLWWDRARAYKAVGILQDKRAEENADWAGKYATVATTAAQEIRNSTAKLESQERLMQALTDNAKSWPPAIELIMRALDRNGDRMVALPDAFRAIVQQLRGG